MDIRQTGRRGVLFPPLLLAAVGVIVLSALSTAAIVGWLPADHSVAPVLDHHSPPAHAGTWESKHRREAGESP